MKIKKKYTVLINAELGSTLQAESLDNLVRCMLSAIEIHYNTSHKGNKVNISLDIK